MKYIKIIAVAVCLLCFMQQESASAAQLPVDGVLQDRGVLTFELPGGKKR